MDFLEYKGYKGSVEYSKEDDCLCGKVMGMGGDLILYEGNTIEELRTEFEEGVESYLAGCRADGCGRTNRIAGVLNIRIPSDVHGRIAVLVQEAGTTMLVQEAGTTINGYIRHVLENCVNSPRVS